MRSFTTPARSSRRLAIALGLALLPVGVAGAADFCVEYGGFNGGAQYTATLVAKSYRPPRRGQCKPFGGMKVLNPGPLHRATVTGTGCASSDGTKLHFSWTEFHSWGVQFARIELPLPLGPMGLAYKLEVTGSPTPYPIRPVPVPCDSWTSHVS